MEHYVVSKEWAEKLKKAGWRKPTKFWWHLSSNGWIVVDNDYKLEIGGIYIPAPLTDELLEVLPDSIEEYNFYLLKDDRGFLVGYCDDEMYQSDPGSNCVICEPIIDKSLPNALAAMLCYLAEQGIVKL